jgi:hypothetical protein
MTIKTEKTTIMTTASATPKNDGNRDGKEHFDKALDYRRRFDYDSADMFRCCDRRSALKASAAFATWTRIGGYRVKSGAHASVLMKIVS